MWYLGPLQYLWYVLWPPEWELLLHYDSRVKRLHYFAFVCMASVVFQRRIYTPARQGGSLLLTLRSMPECVFTTFQGFIFLKYFPSLDLRAASDTLFPQTCDLRWPPLYKCSRGLAALSSGLWLRAAPLGTVHFCTPFHQVLPSAFTYRLPWGPFPPVKREILVSSNTWYHVTL